MIVNVFDIEEAGTSNNNLIDSFNDFSNVSGVANIHFRYPVNNRPTFNKGTAGGLELLQLKNLSGLGSLNFVVDFKADYTRVNSTYLGFLTESAVDTSSHSLSPVAGVSNETPCTGCGSCESAMEVTS
jgi:hypothetical protein